MVGILISPLILDFSKQNEDYTPVHFDPESEGLGDFMRWYFQKGFNCIFKGDSGLKNNICEHSAWYMFGYVVSLFVLQISLQYLMQMKKARHLRTIFAIMVPITGLAFVLGGVT